MFSPYPPWVRPRMHANISRSTVPTQHVFLDVFHDPLSCLILCMRPCCIHRIPLDEALKAKMDKTLILTSITREQNYKKSIILSEIIFRFIISLKI